MRQQILSLKTATKLSKTRQNATKNPFIINHSDHWFDILEKTVKDLGLEDRPDLIRNADELKSVRSFLLGVSQLKK